MSSRRVPIKTAAQRSFENGLRSYTPARVQLKVTKTTFWGKLKNQFVKMLQANLVNFVVFMTFVIGFWIAYATWIKNQKERNKILEEKQVEESNHFPVLLYTLIEYLKNSMGYFVIVVISWMLYKVTCKALDVKQLQINSQNQIALKNQDINKEIALSEQEQSKETAARQAKYELYARFGKMGIEGALEGVKIFHPKSSVEKLIDAFIGPRKDIGGKSDQHLALADKSSK